MNKQTLRGRDLFEKLKCPKTILAPMVDMSELAFRKLCRNYGADLCYSPMYHARLFGSTHQYRQKFICEADGDQSNDRPLIVQFCANDPAELVAAAKLVVGKCDAVDLNLGCPQGIARKGHYGSFLMDEWDLICDLISSVCKEVPDLPITAKIRVFESKEKTLEYAKRILNAGACWLTVHGRTREMKGQLTGLADWQQIKYLRDNLPKETVLIANGNIIYRRNIDECLRVTGADAVMIAETALVNPAIFSKDISIKSEFPLVSKVVRDYFTIAKSTPGNASAVSMKTHMYKLLKTFFAKEHDIRNLLGSVKTRDYDTFESIVVKIEERVNQLTSSEPDEIVSDGDYFRVPHFRCQPFFRIVDGVASNGVVLNEEKAKAQSHGKVVLAMAKKRKMEQEQNASKRVANE